MSLMGTVSRSLRQPHRWLLVLVVVFGWTSWMGHRRLPAVPISHPGFDSSKITPKQNDLRKFRERAISPGPRNHSTTIGTGNICHGYDGVLHIRSGDAGAAAGTVFFIYVVNQLFYAEKYNLLPWIHLNNVSNNIWDPVVHGDNKNKNNTITFEMLHGMTVDFVSQDSHRFGFGSYAGSPKLLLDDQPLTPRDYSVSGTGVWNHYFEPVSAFDPSTSDCRDKPLIRMHYYHLNPGMLWFCPWSVKSWPHSALSPKLAPSTSLKNWYWPMRQKGHAIAQKYFQFQPEIVQLADSIWKQHADRSFCLAMHIRHSDKGGPNRRPIPVESYLPYAQAYIEGGGTSIVLATDSAKVLDIVAQQWPQHVSRAIVRQSDNILRSSNRQAVFVLGDTSHDRTNREVLVDILAMSRCQFFVHGFSAVSEAVMYLNLDLHARSVDVEDHPLNRRMTPDEFRTMVETEKEKNKTKERIIAF